MLLVTVCDALSGIFPKNSSNASNPPAEAPIPTIGKSNLVVFIPDRSLTPGCPDRSDFPVLVNAEYSE
jgi:hypothetical protein